MYFTYAQTPELQSVGSSSERDRVHRIAWRRLRSECPMVFVRSIMIVFGAGILGSLVGGLVGQWNCDASWRFGAVIGAAVGGAIGALLHIHFTASALRPIYLAVIKEDSRS